METKEQKSDTEQDGIETRAQKADTKWDGTCAIETKEQKSQGTRWHRNKGAESAQNGMVR